MKPVNESPTASVQALVDVGRLRRGERRRLLLSVALSAGAMTAAIGLLATSGYLISRAAQRPEILALMVTIVAVRAFGLTRAALRYSERLASHDLALRQLARLRVRFYERLEPLLPGSCAATAAICSRASSATWTRSRTSTYGR